MLVGGAQYHGACWTQSIGVGYTREVLDTLEQGWTHLDLSPETQTQHPNLSPPPFQKKNSLRSPMSRPLPLNPETQNPRTPYQNPTLTGLQHHNSSARGASLSARDRNNSAERDRVPGLPRVPHPACHGLRTPKPPHPKLQMSETPNLWLVNPQALTPKPPNPKPIISSPQTPNPKSPHPKPRTPKCPYPKHAPAGARGDDRRAGCDDASCDPGAEGGREIYGGEER